MKLKAIFSIWIFSFLIANLQAGPIEPKPENALSPDLGWTQYRGPNGAFAASPSAYTMVKSPQEVKRVWTSEEPIPDGRNCGANVTGCDEVSGGYSSPVVWQGKIYLYYYLPDGEVIDNSRGNADKWSIGADDIVICIDAQTGKTLWKKVFTSMGLNFNGFGKSGPQLTPVIYDGKVYAVGTTGNVYCLNAETGDSLWQSDIGPRHEMMEHTKEVWINNKDLGGFNRDMMSNGIVVDDAFIFNTHLLAKGDFPGHEDGRNGLIAIDAQTGEKLWRQDTISGYHTTPSKWVHEGKEYLLTANDNYQTYQYIWCLNARTGDTLWQFESVNQGKGVVVEGDWMLARTENGIGGFKLSMEGPEEKWTIGGELSSMDPAIYDGYAYIRNKEGNLYCYRLEDGQKMGTHHFVLSANTTSVLIMDNLVMTQTEEGSGQYQLFNSDPNNFTKSFFLNTWSPGEVASGYDCPILPVAVDGRVFIRMIDHLAAFDFRDEMKSISIQPAQKRVQSRWFNQVLGNNRLILLYQSPNQHTLQFLPSGKAIQ